MLTAKQISLLQGVDDLAVVIDRQQLQRQQHAADVLAQAQQQAAALLEQARQQCAAIQLEARQQAEQRFWQQADEILQAWRRHYQQLEEQVTDVMTTVVTQALAQLLTEAAEPERITALLRQLLCAKSVEEQGTLYCHPPQQSQIAQWLQQHPQLAWRLTPEASRPADSLRLVTSQGELHLDWQQAVQQLSALCDCHDAVDGNI